MRLRMQLWSRELHSTSWALHRLSQPFVYRFQNAIEAWLLASNILLLALAYVAQGTER